MDATARGTAPLEGFGARRCEADTKRIIVAEDDAEMRDLIAAALRKDGHEVTAVSDGAKLLVEVVARPPERGLDLIVSDLRMPVSSGLQILKGLREAGWKTPFVLLTAFGDDQTRSVAESLDAVFLDKPFELDTLRATVRKLFLTD
jgi:DNA-binding response OmpR family regulator